MSAFDKQNAMADEILTKHRGKVLAIVKATRAGATTSLLKKAYELCQRTVIVAPYTKILETTVEDVKQLVKKAKPKIVYIPANKEICEQIKAKIKKHPSIADLGFHFRPSCKGCKFNDPSRCELQNILSSDWDVLGLTYPKLRALCIGKSKTASDLLEKMKRGDNLILDEFVAGIVNTSPSAPIENPSLYIDNEADLFEGKTKRLSEVEYKMREKIVEFAIYCKSMGDKTEEGKHQVFRNPLSEDDRTFFRDDFAKCWQVVESLAAEEKDTKLLQQILAIIAAENFMINKKEGRTNVIPVEGLEEESARTSVYLRDFVSEYFSKEKLITLVDAYLPDFDLSETLGVPVKGFSWGDPLETNKSQLIICDTSKIGVIEFFKQNCQEKLKLLINFASAIHKPSSILIVTLNSEMAKEISKWKKAKEEKDRIPEDVKVSYYRSELSRGITIDPRHRILILIGAPYLPKIAYLAETYGTDKLAAFRKSDMKSAFINLIGRVKDPMGKEKSVVYAAGITAREVNAFLTQKDIPSPPIFGFLVKGADALDFEIAANSFLHSNELTKKGMNLEKDLPVLERILRVCRFRDKSLTLSEISSKDVGQLQQFIENYPEVLKKFRIKIVKEPRGYRLVPLKS